MAEKSNEQLIPENATFENFTDDLVNYVMFLNCPPVVLNPMLQYNESLVYNGFHESMKITVHSLNNWFDNNKGDFLQIHEDEKLSAETYTNSVKSLIKQYFEKGFEVKSFLSFCVHIAKMAAMYYIKCIDGVRMIAKHHILKIMIQHMTVDRWNNLHRICIECASMSPETGENGNKRKLILSLDEESDSTSSSSKKFSQ